MLGLRVPAILRPDYTWPRPMPADISQTCPKIPATPGPWSLWIWGRVHDALYVFSEYYHNWWGLHFDATIMQLPFGLLMKCSNRSTVREALATKMVYSAGIPTPYVISIGKPRSSRGCDTSILMTRLPGNELVNSAQAFPDDFDEPWLEELKQCLTAMRKWRRHGGSQTICAVDGTQIQGARIPLSYAGPFESEADLTEYLLDSIRHNGPETKEKFDQLVQKASELRNFEHDIVFTHGDLWPHNVLIDRHAHLAGLIDWESAGWLPEYWEFTTAMRAYPTCWWKPAMARISGNAYHKELECENALTPLNCDSYLMYG